MKDYFDITYMEAALDGQPRLDGKKFDEGKPRMGLIATSALWALAKVLTMGASKYGDSNWRLGMDWHRPYDAAQRHLTAWWDGEDKDSESGHSHLWHAFTEIMFLIEYEAKGIGRDTRFKNEKH